ncbi:MAG: hypothetical protein CMH34_05370 [Microbacterium sp.]|nr:hypothetical protein [Microbacterium sp.]
MTRAIKAELARRDLDGNDLVEPLKIGRNAIYARLRYEQPFDLDQIEKVAEFLGMTPDELIDSARRTPVLAVAS